MLKALLLFIFLIIFSVLYGGKLFTGWGFAIFFFGPIIFGILFAVALIVGIVTIKVLNPWRGIPFAIRFLIIPFYIFISFFIAFKSMDFFTQWEGLQKEAQRDEFTKTGWLKKLKSQGKIIAEGHELIYKCKECGYRLKLPSTSKVFESNPILEGLPKEWSKTSIEIGNPDKRYYTIEAIPLNYNYLFDLNEFINDKNFRGEVSSTTVANT